jgi:hypothetical protein
MSMRSYSGLLVFENIYDYIPTANPDIVNFSLGIFEPSVLISTYNCGTTLGSIQTVNYELEGKVELATGLVISKSRIDQLLFNGIYTLATRTLDTCVAPGGVCQLCYAASRQALAVPAVQSRATIEPEYEITTDVLAGSPNQATYTLTLNSDQYDYVYVYIEGVLQSTSTYVISGTTITFNTGYVPTVTENIAVRYTALNRSPFLVYLAQTYSGSILGMQPLPSPMLPIRSLFLNSQISTNRLAILCEYTEGLSQIPTNYLQYMNTIQFPLEKALYMLALNSIFATVTA